MIEESPSVTASTSAQGPQRSPETTAVPIAQTQVKEVDRPEPPAAEPQIADSGADALRKPVQGVTPEIPGVIGEVNCMDFE